MLVLSRKVGEKIVIGDEQEKITVTVLEVSGGKIRIGIEAPNHIKVDREEVRERTSKNG